MIRIGWTLAVWLTLVSQIPLAKSATRLCVQVKASPDDADNLHKLVVNELGHHPSHTIVQSKCDSNLEVELFTLKELHYLTVRINQAIPVRYQFEPVQELSDHLRSALSQVLAHDPVYLMNDISHFSAIQRAAHSVLKRGHNTLRLELFQGMGPGKNDLVYTPGLAFSMSRGADHWQVYARVYFATQPGSVVDEKYLLKINTGADMGLSYEFNRLSNTSLYASAGFGLQYLQYEGRSDPDNARSTDHRNDIGPAFHLRVGVKLMRFYDFDCDFFVTGYLPLFGADSDSRLDEFYSPTLQCGLGVGF